MLINLHVIKYLWTKDGTEFHKALLDKCNIVYNFISLESSRWPLLQKISPFFQQSRMHKILGIDTNDLFQLICFFNTIKNYEMHIGIKNYIIKDFRLYLKYYMRSKCKSEVNLKIFI